MTHMLPPSIHSSCISVFPRAPQAARTPQAAVKPPAPHARAHAAAAAAALAVITHYHHHQGGRVAAEAQNSAALAASTHHHLHQGGAAAAGAALSTDTAEQVRFVIMTWLTVSFALQIQRSILSELPRLRFKLLLQQSGSGRGFGLYCACTQAESYSCAS